MTHTSKEHLSVDVVLHDIKWGTTSPSTQTQVTTICPRRKDPNKNLNNFAILRLIITQLAPID